MTPKVELRLAFEWTCDECGRDSFARAVTVEPESVEHLVPDESLAAFEGTEGDWQMAPESVTCPHCGTEFDVDA